MSSIFQNFVSIEKCFGKIGMTTAIGTTVFSSKIKVAFSKTEVLKKPQVDHG